jgi:hypothetical protein
MTAHSTYQPGLNSEAFQFAVDMSQSYENVRAYALHSIQTQASAQIFRIGSTNWQTKPIPAKITQEISFLPERKSSNNQNALNQLAQR